MSYQNNTIEALKKLYVAMGGTAADVENLNITPEMISAIADIYQGGGGGGSSLPAVTADDNGKVLAVVDGDWDKADNVGGAVVITLSQQSQQTVAMTLLGFLDTETGGTGAYTRYVNNSTIAEYDDIHSAVAQGKRVIINIGTASAEVVTYSEAHVGIHLIIPHYEISASQYMSMLLDISFTENDITIQGFAQPVSA